MARLVGDGFRIFVEIGPHPVLQAYLHDALRAAGRAGPRARHAEPAGRSDADPFPGDRRPLSMSRDMTSSGPSGSTAPPSRDGLPLYPWNKERFWFERTVEASNLINPRFDHPLLGFRQAGAVRSWLNHLDADILPWLADHAVEGVPVLPGAAVVEMALAAARLRRPDAAAIEVSRCRAAPAAAVREGPGPRDPQRRNRRGRRLGTDEPPAPRRRPADPACRGAAGDGRRLRSAAAVRPGRTEPRRKWTPPRSMASPPGSGSITAAGSAPCGASSCSAPERRRRSSIPRSSTRPLAPYIVHPALLDGALQALLALIADRQAGHSGDLAGASFLPWRFGRVRAPAPFGRVPHSARLRVTRIGTRSAAADIALFDEAGAIVAELSDCWFRRVELTRRAAPDDAALRIDLVPAPLGEDAAPAVLAAIADIVGPLAAIPEPRPPRRPNRNCCWTR